MTVRSLLGDADGAPIDRGGGGWRRGAARLAGRPRWRRSRLRMRRSRPVRGQARRTPRSRRPASERTPASERSRARRKCIPTTSEIHATAACEASSGPFITTSPNAMAPTSPATTTQTLRPTPGPADLACADRRLGRLEGRPSVRSTVTNAPMPSARSTVATGEGSAPASASTKTRPKAALISEPDLSGVMTRSLSQGGRRAQGAALPGVERSAHRHLCAFCYRGSFIGSPSRVGFCLHRCRRVGRTGTRRFPRARRRRGRRRLESAGLARG